MQSALQTIGAPSLSRRAHAAETDTVLLHGIVILRHFGPDSVTREHWGWPAVGIEYRGANAWLPAISYAPIMAGTMWPQRIQLRPGDSLAIEVHARALRGEVHGSSDRWVGPLPGRYRYRIWIYRCLRKGELACAVDILSEPFELALRPESAA